MARKNRTPEENARKGFGKGCKPNASYDTSVSQPVIYHIENFLLVDGSHLFTSQTALIGILGVYLAAGVLTVFFCSVLVITLYTKERE